MASKVFIMQGINLKIDGKECEMYLETDGMIHINFSNKENSLEITNVMKHNDSYYEPHCMYLFKIFFGF